MGCSSLKVHTGPQTDEEATQESTDRGRQIRTEWANRLRAATVPEKALLMRTLVDSTSALYIRYGFRVADKWRDESNRRGVDVPIADIRQMVEVSNRTEEPILEAYEDVLEYGIEEILESRYFELDTEELLTGFRDHFLQVRSAVFYPNGSREDFELRLQSLRTRTEELSFDLGEELRRFE
jgi:hypothetical protein